MDLHQEGILVKEMQGYMLVPAESYCDYIDDAKNLADTLMPRKATAEDLGIKTNDYSDEA